MNNKRYKLLLDGEIKQNWLEENHFFWNEARGVYLHRFTVWRISETETVYCEIRLDIHTKECRVDCYLDPKTLYGPAYSDLWGIDQREEMTTIYRRIKDEFHRLGIVEDLDKSLPTPELHRLGRKEQK